MKFKKFFMLLLVLFSISCLAGCDMGSTSGGGVRVVSIEKDSDTFLDTAIINQFDIRDWYIRLVYSDDSTDLVQVTYSMLDQKDIAKLTQVGKHELTFVTAPMVHWPEVIVTYDSYDKVLFSADSTLQAQYLTIQHLF